MELGRFGVTRIALGVDLIQTILAPVVSYFLPPSVTRYAAVLAHVHRAHRRVRRRRAVPGVVARQSRYHAPPRDLGGWS